MLKHLHCITDGVFPSHSLTITVSSTCGIRHREFVEGLVFTIRGYILRAGGRSRVPETEDIFIHFIDKWATAASFIEEGNVVTLEGFEVAVNPVLQSRFVVLPLPEDPSSLSPRRRGSKLLVEQPGEQGDTIEFTVESPHFDDPIARVRSKPKPLQLLCHQNRT